MDYRQMTTLDLLKLFAETFKKYDDLKDEELQIIEDFPNRDMWDDERISNYEDLLDEIQQQAKILNGIVKHVEMIVPDQKHESQAVTIQDKKNLIDLYKKNLIDLYDTIKEGC